MQIPAQWILVSVIIVLGLVVLGVIRLWKWRKRFDEYHAPVAEKLLRPAGESLRRELERVEEALSEKLVFTIFAPVLLTAMALVSTGPDKATPQMIFAVSAVGCFGWGLSKSLRLAERRRDFRLGFGGERAVAEELNQLMREGWWIYHDVPIEPYGNVDHVIVSPRGVFAVETKARRKRKAERAAKEYRVDFDGEALAFPQHRDSDSVEQAQYQANRLGQILTKAVGETVRVQPILTIPGWYVSERVKSRVRVVNPKGIRSVVLASREDSISDKLIRQIAHQLEQRCRDVEF